jgi:plastocyanin
MSNQREHGFGWRRLQVVAAFGVIGSLLVPMLIQLSFASFVLATAAPFAIGLVLMIRWPRVGALWLGVCSLGLLVFSAPFLAESLVRPESLADFIPLAVYTLSTVVGVVAAIPSFRQGSAQDELSGSARAIAVVAGALIVAAAVVSIVAFAGIESESARAGDIRVVAEDIEFHPSLISGDGREMSVYVANRDETRHTFTIDELGVDLNVPPNSDQRVSFAADPGTYTFYCRPHTPGMEGELVVR